MMDSLHQQLIALGVTVLTIVIGYVVAWLRSKIVNGKLAKLTPLVDMLEEQLPKYFEPILKNTYQAIVKGLKGTEQWTDDARANAFNTAYDDLVKTLPNFIVTAIKTLKGGEWVDYLRTKLQCWYELNKDAINK